MLYHDEDCLAFIRMIFSGKSRTLEELVGATVTLVRDRISSIPHMACQIGLRSQVCDCFKDCTQQLVLIDGPFCRADLSLSRVYAIKKRYTFFFKKVWGVICQIVVVRGCIYKSSLHEISLKSRTSRVRLPLPCPKILTRLHTAPPSSGSHSRHSPDLRNPHESSPAVAVPSSSAASELWVLHGARVEVFLGRQTSAAELSRSVLG